MEKGKMTNEAGVWNPTSIFFLWVQNIFLLLLNIGLQKDQELHSSWYQEMFYTAVISLVPPRTVRINIIILGKIKVAGQLRQIKCQTVLEADTLILSL